MGLQIIGLGPSPDLQDLTRRAELALRGAERIFLDEITAGGAERRARSLEHLCQIAVELLGPLDNARRQEIVQLAGERRVVVCGAGDALVATPLPYLVRQARSAGVATQVIPGVSMMTAAPALAGVDAAGCAIVVVDQPQAQDNAQLELISQALQERGVVVVLAAGKQPDVATARWSALVAVLERELGAQVQSVVVDGGGEALVVISS